MEDAISRKFVISIIAILVIILGTNNFGELTGQPVKPISKVQIKCIDNSDIYTPGYAYYSDGSNVAYDSCASSKTLREATCTGGFPRIELMTCLRGCISNACKR